MLFLFALVIAVAGQSSPIPIERQLEQLAGELNLTYPLNKTIQVSAGQEFYKEYRTVNKSVVTYILSKPIRSSMGGSMGFPFSFAIDDVSMVTNRTRDGWTYYAPKSGKFRASHGLLGSVLAEGDTVGLRVHRDDRKEWFVDNSRHNGYTTIWSRKVKAKDPEVTVKEVIARTAVGPVSTLTYLGTTDSRVRIRLEQISPDNSVTRDDFEFPVGTTGAAFGSVLGATFKVTANATGATIEVQTPMTGTSGTY